MRSQDGPIYWTESLERREALPFLSFYLEILPGERRGREAEEERRELHRVTL